MFLIGNSVMPHTENKERENIRYTLNKKLCF